jgi:hypothetical protein
MPACINDYMAEIKSINMQADGISVSLKITEEEYSLLKSPKGDMLLLPADSQTLEESLTTGRLGNGNRIMLPNKVMSKYHVKKLHKKVPAKIFEVSGGRFLLIKLEDNRPGVPSFEVASDG